MTPLVLHLPRARAERLPGLDAARAFAVMAMVVGHTADGLLSDASRALSWIPLYWEFRGLTAPMFLVVSGWAVAEWASRSGLTGWPLVRSKLARVALLLGCGFVLRWPGWDVEGVLALKKVPWEHLLAFDALYCIAWSVLAGTVLFALVPALAARRWVLAGAAAGIPLASAAVHAAVVAADAPALVRLALVSDATSPFALFPWAGYFFAGALIGHLLPLVRGSVPRAAALLATSGVMLALTSIVAVDWSTAASPTMFAHRLGQILAILAGVALVPAVVSKRLATVGRSSLVVYVAHLPIVYGWSTSPGLVAHFGRTLQPWEVLSVAACLLAFGLALAAAIRWTKAAAPRLTQLLATRGSDPARVARGAKEARPVR
ncbi:MAG TPA: acyltransferase [Myxococcaceae bacterium]|nr:acyltransferase [Myxococcaceae bacterium]